MHTAVHGHTAAAAAGARHTPEHPPAQLFRLEGAGLLDRPLGGALRLGWGGDDIYLVSREDGRGGCEVTAYLAAESGCEELRATMSEGVRTLFLRDGKGRSVYTGEFDVRGDVMTIDGLTDAAGNAALGETSLVRLAEGQAARARGR